MKLTEFNELKSSAPFIESVRWDITPKIFVNPRLAPGEPADLTYGFMLYVDQIEDKPALIVMQLKELISKSVGYVFDIPEELLRDSMQCIDSDCIGGMYPLSEKLEDWLKKQFGLS